MKANGVESIASISSFVFWMELEVEWRDGERIEMHQSSFNTFFFFPSPFSYQAFPHARPSLVAAAAALSPSALFI
jgi:hypothetical protein